VLGRIEGKDLPLSCFSICLLDSCGLTCPAILLISGDASFELSSLVHSYSLDKMNEDELNQLAKFWIDVGV